MKKILLSVLTVLTLMTVLFPSAGSALDMSVGAATWYSWWDMSSDDNTIEYEADPTFLYGPVFSVKFDDDFSVTGAFLYGVFDFTQRDSSTGTTVVNTMDMTRLDGDLALNYRLMSFLKVYLGAKYTSYTFDPYPGITMEHSALGAGAGVSATLPVADSLYLIANVGGVYLWGTEETEYDSSYTMTSDESDDSIDYGVNTTVQLAYYIESASVTVSLGGRYQYLYADYEEGDSLTHQFWGATLSAIYSFSI